MRHCVPLERAKCIMIPHYPPHSRVLSDMAVAPTQQPGEPHSMGVPPGREAPALVEVILPYVWRRAVRPAPVSRSPTPRIP